jgi:ubiquinone/menaquinone biosynthesis C-methylase UbiE
MQRSRHSHHAFSILVLLLLGSTLALAGEQSVRPGVNRHYENPDWPVWVARFERPDREVYAKRRAIVSVAGLHPGMAVADIGAGTGLFTRLFAPRVSPGGKVYAVDISPAFVENILRTCREQGLANVEGIVNTPRDVALPPASIDLAFLSNTYHHFEYPQTMLASIRRALRPGGRLIVIDFRKQPGISTRWVMGHVRTNRDTAIREIRSAGYRLLENKPLLRSNYFLEFEKTGP